MIVRSGGIVLIRSIFHQKHDRCIILFILMFLPRFFARCYVIFNFLVERYPMPGKDFFPTSAEELKRYLEMEQMSARIHAELNAKLNTVLARMDSMQETFERTLGPLAASVQEIEELKRKINLTPEEVERVYSLNSATLANKRAKAAGPRYIKDGGKILYPQRELQKYLNVR